MQDNQQIVNIVNPVSEQEAIDLLNQSLIFYMTPTALRGEQLHAEELDCEDKGAVKEYIDIFIYSPDSKQPHRLECADIWTEYNTVPMGYILETNKAAKFPLGTCIQIVRRTVSTLVWDTVYETLTSTVYCAVSHALYQAVEGNYSFAGELAKCRLLFLTGITQLIYQINDPQTPLTKEQRRNLSRGLAENPNWGKRLKHKLWSD